MNPTKPGKTIVRILALAWIFYGVFLDDNPATGIVFFVFGLLLLLLSELAMEALPNHPAMRDEHRIGWW